MQANNKNKTSKIKNKRSIYEVIKDHQLILILVTVLLSITYYQSKSIVPEYAIINKDGSIAFQRSFGEYGLFIEKKEIKFDYGKGPIYIITFKKEPDYFEISNRNGLLSKVKQIEANKYSVEFFGVGGYLGNKAEESEFKIQSY